MGRFFLIKPDWIQLWTSADIRPRCGLQRHRHLRRARLVPLRRAQKEVPVHVQRGLHGRRSDVHRVAAPVRRRRGLRRQRRVRQRVRAHEQRHLRTVFAVLVLRLGADHDVGRHRDAVPVLAGTVTWTFRRPIFSFWSQSTPETIDVKTKKN